MSDIETQIVTIYKKQGELSLTNKKIKALLDNPVRLFDRASMHAPSELDAVLNYSADLQRNNDSFKSLTDEIANLKAMLLVSLKAATLPSGIPVEFDHIINHNSFLFSCFFDSTDTLYLNVS